MWPIGWITKPSLLKHVFSILPSHPGVHIKPAWVKVRSGKIVGTETSEKKLPASSSPRKNTTHLPLSRRHFAIGILLDLNTDNIHFFHLMALEPILIFFFFFPEALSVSTRCFCWTWVLVHITSSHWDRVLVQRKGSHYLIMLLILGTRKRCLQSFGPHSKCWSGTLRSLLPWVTQGDFGTWVSSKKQFATYTVELQKCLIEVRHQTWMIPYEIATFCLR